MKAMKGMKDMTAMKGMKAMKKESEEEAWKRCVANDPNEDEHPNTFNCPPLVVSLGRARRSAHCITYCKIILVT